MNELKSRGSPRSEEAHNLLTFIKKGPTFDLHVLDRARCGSWNDFSLDNVASRVLLPSRELYHCPSGSNHDRLRFLYCR